MENGVCVCLCPLLSGSFSLLNLINDFAGAQYTSECVRACSIRSKKPCLSECGRVVLAHGGARMRGRVKSECLDR